MDPQPLLRRTFKVALAALLVVAGAASATPASAAPAVTRGTTFHVDCSRSKNGDGSTAAPWNSIGSVNGHGRYAPGEQILFKRGTSCAGQLHPAGNGTRTAPIVVGAYDKGALPTINGGGTARDTGAITLRNQAYWTIQDLHVTNRTAAKETKVYRAGVMVHNDAGGRLGGITVQRLRIDSMVSNLTFFQSADPREFGGIAVITWPGARTNSGFDGLRIVNNRLTKVGRTGIVVSNHGYPKTSDTAVRISGNTVTRPRGDSIVVRGSRNARIDHNVSAQGADLWPCKQCGKITPDTANAAIWPAFSMNTMIDHNEVYGEHKLGGDGVGIDVDQSAEKTVVEYNYVHDNEGGGLLFCGSNDTTARFNILENNARAAFVFIGSIPATNTKIYNNTVYTKRGVQARVVHTQGDKGGKGITFFNNVFFNLDDSGYFVWPTTPKSKTNTYIGVHGIGEPADAKKGYVNPGVRRPGTGGNGFGTLNGYKVTKNAYTMAGSPIPGSVKKDFFGKTINPKKPPRGAAG